MDTNGFRNSLLVKKMLLWLITPLFLLVLINFWPVSVTNAQIKVAEENSQLVASPLPDYVGGINDQVNQAPTHFHISCKREFKTSNAILGLVPYHYLSKFKVKIGFLLESSNQTHAILSFLHQFHFFF